MKLLEATFRIILVCAGFQIKLRSSGYKQCRGSEQMNLTMVMFGHMNTDTGTCGHTGIDPPKL